MILCIEITYDENLNIDMTMMKLLKISSNIFQQKQSLIRGGFLCQNFTVHFVIN